MTALTHDLDRTDETVPLSQRLREGTRPEHEQAEASGFVERLMSGRLDVAAYADLAAQQWAIYGALEDASAAMREDAQGSTLVFDELTRTPEIEKDLTFLVGPDWAERITIHPATERYVARLRAVGTSLPAYAAHAYTRYLGDLSGGQFIRKVMQRRFGFDTNGVGFYLFDEIADPQEFKQTYRDELDQVDWDDAERERVIDEVLLAYRFNTELFDDLAKAKAAA